MPFLNQANPAVRKHFRSRQASSRSKRSGGINLVITQIQAALRVAYAHQASEPDAAPAIGGPDPGAVLAVMEACIGIGIPIRGVHGRYKQPSV